MNPELKEKLLQRMFSSPEYMREMERYFNAALEGLYESLEWFEKNPPEGVSWETWHIAEKPEGWRIKAVPNLERLRKGIEEGIERVENGGSDALIRTVANNVMALSRDMDVLGDQWWDYVPQEIAFKYGKNMTKAKKMASNIAWTLGEAWKDDEILRERITGPIDEQELLKYLKPGESVDT